MNIYVKLFGGEKDGYDAELKCPDGAFPEMFYVHRNIDDGRIRDAKDEELKEILTNALAILAYEFDSITLKDGVPGGKQYRYNRRVEADRSIKDPAC